MQPRFNNYLYSYFVKQIENQNSVSVHIRRTDFISRDWNSDENVHFYFAAMNYLRKHVERPHFYIFSDDMEWTRKQFRSVDDCSFVDSFGGEVQSLYDMFCIILRHLGMMKKVICAHNKAYEKNYNFINESLTPLYTWDTYVNDEESIWQTFSIINGILEN